MWNFIDNTISPYRNIGNQSKCCLGCFCLNNDLWWHPLMARAQSNHKQTTKRRIKKMPTIVQKYVPFSTCQSLVFFPISIVSCGIRNHFQWWTTERYITICHTKKKKTTTKNYVEINLSIHCKNSSFKFALNMSMVIHHSSAIVRSIVFTQKKKKKKMNNKKKKLRVHGIMQWKQSTKWKRLANAKHLERISPFEVNTQRLWSDERGQIQR